MRRVIALVALLTLALELPLATKSSARVQSGESRPGQGVKDQRGLEARAAFLKMFARSYFPGRTGQLMLVPREGNIITRRDPAINFMHGSPWTYDTAVPVLFFGPGFIRKEVQQASVVQQDVAPTLAALLGLRMPSTATGRVLKTALSPSAETPRAIFLAVLDGTRADYLDRHAALLPTLTRLRSQGAWFANARVNCIPTNTGVAHTTISTGTDPRFHGITGNATFDRVKGRAQDTYSGMSPRDLMALTLGDVWNIHTDGRAVIIAQGSSVPAAIALAGHGACLFNGRPIIMAVYNRSTGSWESNPECYRLPGYLKEKNARSLWEAHDGRWLGHSVATADSFRRSALFSRFEADALVALIEQEPLGKDEVTDLVLANLKAIDYVSHQYGPDSTETKEALAEQDRQLSRILKALDQKIGASRYVVAITADHGMPAEPQRGRGRYFSDDLVKLLHEKFDPGSGKLITHYEPENCQIAIDMNRLRELGLKLADLARFLEAQPFIFAAYTEDEVRQATVN